jgi:hypothetical protein
LYFFDVKGSLSTIIEIGFANDILTVSFIEHLGDNIASPVQNKSMTKIIFTAGLGEEPVVRLCTIRVRLSLV